MTKVLLLGGSGFVGTVIANRLAQLGIATTVPSRRRERSRALLSQPGLTLVQADINDPATLTQLIGDHDAVINLVGILHSRDVQFPYSRDFARAHVELPEKIVAACRATGVRRLLHMSALKAAPGAPSEYLASKGDGEARVLAAGDALDVTVFRPSAIFGSDDRFLNVFARLLRFSRWFPLACAEARLQPVHVGDVAGAFVAALADSATYGQSYDLCGPQVYTLRQLVASVGRMIGRDARIVALPEALGYVQAGLMWLAPKPLLSPDNLRSLQVDSVCDAACHAPPGWTPAALEAIAPAYLAPQTAKARRDDFRRRAGR